VDKETTTTTLTARRNSVVRSVYNVIVPADYAAGGSGSGYLLDAGAGTDAGGGTVAPATVKVTQEGFGFLTVVTGNDVIDSGGGGRASEG
jgi:hypothetical protein